MYNKIIMEYTIDDKYKNILKTYLDKKSTNNESESDSDLDNELENNFDKDQYTKFYDILNNICLFLVINTFETLFKNLDYNIDSNEVNKIIKNNSNLTNTLKLQLNIIWSEFDDSILHDKLLIDFKDLLDLNIIKHKFCLFSFVKSNVLSLFNELSKLEFSENIEKKSDLIEKIAKFTNAILVINKFTGLEDEDEFECVDCNNKYVGNIFWN